MLHIVAAVLRRDRHILICQRSRSGAMPLRWEFPGGKVEAEESEPDALRRELREELGIEARPGRLLARVRHAYPESGVLELAFYEVRHFVGEPVNRVFEQVAWELPSRFDTYDFLPADRPVLDLLHAKPTA